MVSYFASALFWHKNYLGHNFMQKKDIMCSNCSFIEPEHQKKKKKNPEVQ